MSKHGLYGDRDPVATAWQLEVKLLWYGTDENGKPVVRQRASFGILAKTPEMAISGAMDDLKTLAKMRPVVQRSITIAEAAKRAGLK